MSKDKITQNQNKIFDAVFADGYVVDKEQITCTNMICDEGCDIYISEMPGNIKIKKVVPQSRENEINDCKNTRLKEQKYYVWKVLEYALNRSLELDIKNVDLFKSENGKWICSSCEISLSHCGSAVAVAISGKPVGIDIERLWDRRFNEKLLDRILTADEKLHMEEIMENDGEKANVLASKLWTEKESIFKKRNEGNFKPSEINTVGEKLYTCMLRLKEEYAVSIALDAMENLHIFNISITDDDRIHIKEIK